MERLAVGVMTGSSIDGIDAALVRLSGRGMSMRAVVARHRSRPLGPLADGLRRAAAQTPLPAGTFASLALDLGELHAVVIDELLRDEQPDLIAVHGQTVFHAPPVSWQLINTAPLARRWPCPIVSDLRQADLAAGGEGAPITPRADWILFGSTRRRRVVVNLGGFCNVTVLPAADPDADPAVCCDQVDGRDVCVCNQLLDAIARDMLGAPYDVSGRAAASGTVDQAAAAALGRLLHRQHAAGRSLGTADALLDWPRMHAPALTAEDLAATAVAAIAQTIASVTRSCEPDELVIAGGGTRNDALVAALRDATAVPVITSDVLGVPVQAREAAAMGVLGALTLDGVAVTSAAVTGRGETSAGGGLATLRHATSSSDASLDPRHPWGQPA